MAKQPKRPRDPNQLVKIMVDIATGEAQDEELTAMQERAAKGGAVGGSSAWGELHQKADSP